LKQHYNTLLVTNYISSIHTLELGKELKDRGKVGLQVEEVEEKVKEKERNFEKKKDMRNFRLQLRVLLQLEL